MPKITYTCDDCGKEFESGRVRKGPKFCQACVEERRKKGQGPTQLAKAGVAPEAKVGVTPTVAVEKEKPAAPVVPQGTTLSELARELREKHAKGEPPVTPTPVVEEKAEESPGESIENVEE